MLRGTDGSYIGHAYGYLIICADCMVAGKYSQVNEADVLLSRTKMYSRNKTTC